MALKIKIDRRNINEAYFPYVYDYSHRYVVFYGGAGSGKSHFIAQRMIIKALMNKRKMLFVRKVAVTIKDSIFALVIQTLEQLQVLSLCTVNRSTYTITLPNSSVIIMKGNDDSEKIKSINGITDIWIEEATELSYNDFLQLDLRLRALVPHQEIVLSFNPVSKANWCYQHWFLKKPEDALVVQTTYKDNAFLPPAYVKNLLNLARYNESYYRVYALGEFATLDKLVYTNYRVAAIPDEVKAQTKVVGLDFGYTNDPTAAVEIYYDARLKRLYITNEIYGKGLSAEGIYDALETRGLSKWHITADSAEPRTIAELRRKNLSIAPSKKGRDSVLHGITWLQAQEIIVAPQCKNLLVEFENYTWLKDKKTNEYYNTPIDEFNHCLDALRYATEKYAIGNTVKTMDKSLLGI